MGNILDSKRNQQILNSFIEKKEEIEEVDKAYTEGIYADTPANRKLGRVGMTYAAYTAKTNGGEKVDIKKEEDLPYNFPAPDYITFKTVKWENPDSSNTKIGTVSIHRYGKKKPEIVITPKNGYDQSVILLKNSELRKLLVGMAKQEDVSMKLVYSEEDMQAWSSNKQFNSKEISLDYDAANGTITYKRVPNSKAFITQEFTFPASALNGVLEQFAKEKKEEPKQEVEKKEEVKVEEKTEKKPFNINIKGSTGLSGNKKWSFKIGEGNLSKPFVVEGEYKDAEREAIKEARIRGVHTITVL